MFLHNFPVRDIICLVIQIFFSLINDFHKPIFYSIDVFQSCFPSTFFLSPLAFYPSWGSVKSVWGPMGPASAGHSHRLMWCTVTVYFIHIFFQNCIHISPVVFSERESFTSLAGSPLKGLSAKAKLWDSAGGINSLHNLISRAVPHSVTSVPEAVNPPASAVLHLDRAGSGNYHICPLALGWPTTAQADDPIFLFKVDEWQNTQSPNMNKLLVSLHTSRP